MVYGWCLLRVIHFIVALRFAHPNTRILVAKFDFSDAYRRVFHAASAMVKSILVVAGIAYLVLRLTFGGAPNTPTWCCISEMLTDLACEVPLCTDWDPPVDPTQQFDTLDDDVPFGAACDMACVVPVTVTFRCDCFVDDIIQAFLDTIENRRLLPTVVAFVANHFFHPTPGKPNLCRAGPSSPPKSCPPKVPRQRSRLSWGGSSTPEPSSSLCPTTSFGPGPATSSSSLTPALSTQRHSRPSLAG
jgi:hypothetical protein